MVDFPIRTNVFNIGEMITTPIAKGIDQEWFDDDIRPITSGMDRGVTIVIDFSYSVSTIVEYTLDGGATFVAFNQGLELTGGQSRYIRLTSGSEVNFRAKMAGTLNRAIVGEV